MHFDITIDESLSESTLLKVFYRGEDKLSTNTLTLIESFVNDHKKHKCELIFTAVKLLYITYDKSLIRGEELALELYEKLLMEDEHTIIIDESSSEPRLKWKIIKSSKQ